MLFFLGKYSFRLILVVWWWLLVIWYVIVLMLWFNVCCSYYGSCVMVKVFSIMVNIG